MENIEAKRQKIEELANKIAIARIETFLASQALPSGIYLDGSIVSSLEREYLRPVLRKYQEKIKQEFSDIRYMDEANNEE